MFPIYAIRGCQRMLCLGWMLFQTACLYVQIVSAQPGQGAALFIEGFDGGSSGWTVTGDAQGQSVQPTYRTSGGNPGGFIEARDDATGGVWKWNAPLSFCNALKSAWRTRGQRQLELTFDLRQSDISSPFEDSDVLLTGAGLTLSYDATPAPAVNWTSYRVPLAAPKWRNTTTKHAATEAEIAAVMSVLTSLHIRGEFRTGADTGGLDNVGFRLHSTMAIKPPGATATLRFTHQTASGFVPVRQLLYNQPFYVELLFTKTPMEKQRIIKLEWRPGSHRDIKVVQTKSNPKLFRSGVLLISKPDPFVADSPTIVEP